MTQMERFRYHIAEDPDAHGTALEPEVVRGVQRPEDAGGERRFTSAESAARFYLAEKLDREQAPGLHQVVREDRPERVPDLALSAARRQMGAGTTLVRFEQTRHRIPVFGAEAVVEIDEEQRLVSMDCRLGDVAGVDPVPRLTGPQALDRIREATGTTVPAGELPPPALTFVGREGTWHLAWNVREVPAQLPVNRRTGQQRGHGLDASPRAASPLTGYLVDAHTGEILQSYGMAPTAAVPVKLEGDDETSVHRHFHGRHADDAYLLDDRWQQITTYDLEFGDLGAGRPPRSAVASQAADFGARSRAGVSAHVNAARVEDFYRSVLYRDGIDDEGMDLVSTVNCTYGGTGQEWKNAVWWNKRMWYGQVTEGERLVSLARHLDVIGHELTHGVIESSCNLVYQDQSGALNESLADTMGVIIRNWYQAPARDDVRTWSWEIGSALGEGGGPLRDMSDPARTGDPAHMRAYDPTPHDNGGVHTNSNIHNKAMHHLLTSVDAAGQPVLKAEEWALLVYLAMVRLLSVADFDDMRAALGNVARTYLAGLPDQRAAVLTAVDDAYRRVGVVG